MSRAGEWARIRLSGDDDEELVWNWSDYVGRTSAWSWSERTQEWEGRWVAERSGSEPKPVVEVAWLNPVLDMLRCPECGEALTVGRGAVCGPLHAMLQDSPMQHPVLRPLLEKAVSEVRQAEPNGGGGKGCPKCGVPVATAGCVHVVERWGQVRMAAALWTAEQDRLEKAEAAADEAEARLADAVEMQSEVLAGVMEDRPRWARERVEELVDRLERMGVGPGVRATVRAQFEHVLDAVE